MDKIDEPKLLEQCDKDPEEETPNEPMDGTLESIDLKDLEKEYTEETIEQGNETMKCNESGEDVIKLSDLERVVMECCEEISDGEVENSKVERKVEKAQPENVTLKTWWNLKWL
ncbi:hypothetical protein TNCV_4670341 [Trichonephila clavipes]|nr:hypothetical protein TNCV_4670341 [Trichonephila clavipes]